MRADSGCVEASAGTRRQITATAAALGASAFVAAWIGGGLGPGRVTLWVDDAGTPAAAALGLWFCVRARAGQRGRMRLHWSLMSVAMACWMLAETIWGVYALILERSVPAPSWADLGYLAAIPFAAAALVVHPGARRHTAHTIRSVLDGLVVATSLLFISWALVLGPLWHRTALGTLQGAVTVAYPFGDIVIAFFIVVAIRGMRGGRTSLWYLLGGLLAMALSDSVYTYLVEIGRYSSSGAHVIDAGWIAAYLGIALAGWSSSAPRGAVRRRERSTPPLASLVLPLVPVLVALLVTAIQIRTGHHLDRTTLLLAVALATLVVVRESLLLHELLRPPPGRPNSSAHEAVAP